MNILRFAIHQAKLQLRDKKTLTYMLLFPIGLIFVLGNALSGAYDDENSIGDTNIIYMVERDNPINNYIKEVSKSLKDENIDFKRYESESKALKDIENKKIHAYIQIKDNEINLYKNNRYEINSDIAEGIVRSITNKYNLISKVTDIKDKSALYKNTEGNYITEKSLSKQKSPGAMDYYSLAIILMIGMYSAMDSVSYFLKENRLKTANRIISSPVSRYEVFAGKILGGIVSNYSIILILFIMCKYLFNANFGTNIPLVLLALLTEVIFFVGLGVTVGYIGKTPEMSRSIINIFVQVSSFLGGAYFKLDSGSGLFSKLVNIIPLRWNLLGLLDLVYADSSLKAINSILLNLVAALVLIGIASQISSRKEGL